jgi:hypothetical protein
MKKRDLTPELILAVACPTCGVAAGKKCILHAGGQRIEPHVGRKLLAIEALEKE